MAATPPPPSTRARTPPTPLHGARYDTYEPYSPRRSKRTTAQSNPYSSFNSDRSPKRLDIQHNTPPPTSAKRARFAERPPTQLSSPPSSPSSPPNITHHRRLSPRQQADLSSSHKTPRKSTTFTPRAKHLTIHPDGDNLHSSNLAPPTHLDPITMLPTPSKTPNKKHQKSAALASTARILSFQPIDPNDVMPSHRQRVKKSQHSRGGAFDLYDDASTHMDEQGRRDGEIEIYTDANARVPVRDESGDNPFVGSKKTGRSRPARVKSQRDAEIEEAVRQDEGVAYVFRGKKIFRRFEDGDVAHDSNHDLDSAAADEDISASPTQRRLRNSAGATAKRPLTRSAIKPRLLFPSEEQRREREGHNKDEDDDEEAVTDIEMSGVEIDGEGEHVKTPVKGRFVNGSAAGVVTPPPTKEATSSSKAKKMKGKGKNREVVTESEGEADATPSKAGDEETGELMSVGSAISMPSKTSPFESWQRTKIGRKRSGTGVAEDEGLLSGGKGKRVKGTRGAIASPE